MVNGSLKYYLFAIYSSLSLHLNCDSSYYARRLVSGGHIYLFGFRPIGVQSLRIRGFCDNANVYTI